jgi:hypothetical protein
MARFGFAGGFGCLLPPACLHAASAWVSLARVLQFFFLVPFSLLHLAIACLYAVAGFVGPEDGLVKRSSALTAVS